MVLVEWGSTCCHLVRHPLVGWCIQLPLESPSEGCGLKAFVHSLLPHFWLLCLIYVCETVTYTFPLSCFSLRHGVSLLSYTKPRGQIPDYTAPVILKSDRRSIEVFCNKIHRAILRQLK